MRGKERAALRAEAHHLRPLFQIGQAGLTDSLVAALDEALAARELVKFQVAKNASSDIRQAAGELALRLSATVVQVIGRTATLYRPNPELKRSADGTPPWRSCG
jgi:RNA-binding protein